MKWQVISEQYLDYLREADHRVPRTDYKDRMKPFFGVLFEKNDLSYLVAISSPKEKHITMKNNIDFVKICRQDNSIISVVNLNYMFPVPTSDLEELLYANIDQYRIFRNMEEKNSYISILSIELTQINRMDIDAKAHLLYEKIMDHPSCEIARRCLNFRLLEGKANEWIETQSQLTAKQFDSGNSFSI